MVGEFQVLVEASYSQPTSVDPGSIFGSLESKDLADAMDDFKLGSGILGTNCKRCDRKDPSPLGLKGLFGFCSFGLSFSSKLVHLSIESGQFGVI